jgi:FkbM family methyltransferase
LRSKFGSNPNFILIDKAVSNKEGQQEFYLSNAHTLSSMSKEWIEFSRKETFKEATWEDKVIVETTSMDKLISEFGVPKFCKIDVEGFELTVLEGLTRPLNVVSIEYTLGLMQPTLNCIKYLNKLGSAQFNYSEGESLVLKLSNWTEPKEMIKLLQGLQSPVQSGDIYARFIR